ncbi:MAG: ABC transporter permease [Deltaproteobacteria bacterium]|nr:ABC transporter permease [Deltaproteobacteria bacterium]
MGGRVLRSARNYTVSLMASAASLGLGLGIQRWLWPELGRGDSLEFALLALVGLMLGAGLARSLSRFPGLEGLLASALVPLGMWWRDGFQLGLGNVVDLGLAFEAHFAALTLGALLVFMARGGGLAWPVRLGLRYLRFKMITAISVVGVAIGVAALMVVLSVMSGFEGELRDKIVGAHAHALLQKRGMDFEEHPMLMAKLNRVPGVVAATPFIYQEVMVTSGKELAGVFIRGIDPATAQAVTPLDIEQGKMSDLRTSEAGPGLFLGRELAKVLKVKLGDTVQVISPLSEEMGPSGPVPRRQAFRVAGVFHTGMYEYDARSVVVSLSEAQRFFGLGRAVTGIALRFDELDKAGQRAKEVLTALDGYPYFVRTWYQLNRNLFSALKLQKVSMFVVLIIIILVSAFGIVSTLVMLVWEKIKEIAILKSMGATADGVMKIFMAEGLAIGILGTGLGLALGWLACMWVAWQGIQLDPEVYYIERMPVDMDPLQFLLIAGVALHISFLATLYPSSRASRLTPVDGLRYD